MKRLVFFLSAVVVVAGTATAQGVGYGLEMEITMDQAITTAVEKDHRPQIWALRIEDSLEDYEDALEDSEDAIGRTYANEERWSMKSIQNKQEIYLIPLMNWFGLTGFETSAGVQEEATKADASDAWMNLYVAQKNQEQASREFELAKLQLEALQVNAQALLVLQQELIVQQAAQHVELTAKKLAYWTGLEVDADAEMGAPKMVRSIFFIPETESYVEKNLLVSDAVWQSLYSYETTVLNIQAIEDGFRGPNFEENQPDSYQTYVIDQWEGAFALEEAFLVTAIAKKPKPAERRKRVEEITENLGMLEAMDKYIQNSPELVPLSEELKTCAQELERELEENT